MIMHRITSCPVSYQFQIFRAFFLNFQGLFFESFKKINLNYPLRKTNPKILPIGMPESENSSKKIGR
jgi:hypothetical protein